MVRAIVAPVALCLTAAALPAIEMVRVLPSGGDGSAPRVEKRVVADPALLGLLVAALCVAAIMALLLARGGRRPPPRSRRVIRYR